MTSVTPTTPVLVGIGVASQRERDPRSAKEPLDLMLDAVRGAAHDAGVPGLLAGVQRVAVPKGRWDYANPAGAIARAIGADGASTVLATVGVLQQSLIADACARIAAGEIDAALVVGGDAGFRLLRSQIEQIACADSQQDDAPDETWKPHDELRHPAELRAGLKMPIGLYALLESAFRAAHGWGIPEHRARIAGMYERFAQIAHDNDEAWDRTLRSGAEIVTPAERNAWQAAPFTRLLCTTWSVDQASALLFCSAAKARAMGVDPSRWIYPLASAQSNHMVKVSERWDLARVPGARVAGHAALEASGLAIEQVDLVELYSCFPVSVELYAAELGVPPGRDLTVTGGMSFAGGPYNNYVLQATARMARLLREGRGRTGIVSASSGIITKQAFGTWGTQPGALAYRSLDVTDEVAASTRTKPVAMDYAGPASIVAFTALHDRGRTPRAIALAETPGGERVMAFSEEPAIVEAFTGDHDHVGARIVAQADGLFSIA